MWSYQHCSGIEFRKERSDEPSRTCRKSDTSNFISYIMRLHVVRRRVVHIQDNHLLRRLMMSSRNLMPRTRKTTFVYFSCLKWLDRWFTLRAWIPRFTSRKCDIKIFLLRNYLTWLLFVRYFDNQSNSMFFLLAAKGQRTHRQSQLCFYLAANVSNNSNIVIK